MAETAYQVTGFAYQGDGLFAYQGSGSTPPVETIPMGGSGWPVAYHQGKRKKLTLKDQPDKHIRSILDKVVSEYYGEIVDSDVPKSVKADAARIVKPFAKGSAAVPMEAQVDWAALNRDADAVNAILAIWNEEIANQEIDEDDDDMMMMIN